MGLQSISVGIAPLVAALVTATLASGCGNMGPYGRSTRQTSLGGTLYAQSIWSSLNLAAEVTSEFACANPLARNIQPQRNAVANDNNTFIACPHASNPADIALVSEGTSRAVCVFPVQYVNSSNFYAKLDLLGNEPMYDCRTLVDSRSAQHQAYSRHSFPATNYNAVFVVNAEDRPAMSACLQDAMVSATGMMSCPAFSFGVFRANRASL